MQRKLIQGIPFWLDAQNRVYAYDPTTTENPIWLGTYSPQTEKIEFRDDWRDAYSSALVAYRQQNQARSRLPAATPAKKAEA
jgi:hypothetical protein